VLGGLHHVGPAHRTGQFGVEPVARPHQESRPVQQLGREQAVQILGGQRVEGRLQLSYDTSQQTEHLFES